MILFIIPKTISVGVFKAQLKPIIEKAHSITTVGVFYNGVEKHFDDLAFIHENNFFSKKRYEFLKKMRSVEKIYCRDIFGFIQLYLFRLFFRYRFQIFYDFRGLISEESYYRNNKILRKKILMLLESFVFKKADIIGTVSNQLKNELKTRYGSKDIFVTPCCIPEKSIYLKNKPLKEPSSIKLVYSGGLSKWQKIDEILKIYQNLSKKINCKLTLITPDKEKAQLKIEKLKLKNINVISLPHEKVSEELKKHHFGFLIRDTNIINKTASPIKFLEYTSNGVIPIISNNVGDFSNFVFEKKIGIIAENNQELTQQVILKTINDDSILKKLFNFSKEFTWEKRLKNHPLFLK